MSVALRPAGGRYARILPLAVDRLEDRLTPTGNAVLDWSTVALEANAVDHGLARPDQPGPGKTARAFAIVHAAVYDAVNGVGRTHTPYLVTRRAPSGADADAAAAGAAYTTLVGLFPQQAAAFDAALQLALAGIPDGPGEKRGLDYGTYVGERHTHSRHNDGANAPMSYTPTGEPGHHDVDPLHPDQGFLGPQWGEVRPFAVKTAEQFRIDPPPALASAAYADAFNEVKVVGAADAETSDRDGDGLPDRTPEQTEIGLYWGYDGSPGLGTPPRLYFQIAHELIRRQRHDPAETARLLALVGLAQADASIVCWNDKYFYDVWRPILGVRGADRDDNPATAAEPDWEPLGAPRSNDPGPNKNFTPPFPSYASGHATMGAAAFRVLADFYGSDAIPGGPLTFVSDELNGVTLDQDGTARPLRPRTFTTFGEMTEENGQSRMYLGIHWNFDKTAGIKCGTHVADWVFQNYLKPLRPDAASKVGGDRLAASPAATPTPPETAAGTSLVPVSPDPTPPPQDPPQAEPVPSAVGPVVPTPDPDAGEDGLALDGFPVLPGGPV